MGFNWLAFAGGAAEAGSKYIETKTRDAKDAAEAQVKQMYSTYMTRKKEADETIGKLSENVSYLRSVMPTATEGELFDIAQNPAVMSTVISGIKNGNFDPNLINLSNVAKASKENDGKTAEQMIQDLYGLKTAPAPEKAPEEKGIVGFIRGIGKEEGEQAAERLAGVAGVSMDKLRGAQEYTKPTYQAKSALNLEVMEEKRPIDDRINDAVNAVASAREAMSKIDKTDTKAVEAAGQSYIDSLGKLGRLTAAKSLTSTKDKTESQIQADLITEITKLPDGSDKRKQLEGQLRERQRLEKLLTGSDSEKVTVANKITSVRSAYNEMIKSALPTGSFTIDANGNIQMTAMVKDSMRQAAVIAAQQALVKPYINAEGKIPNEGDRLALRSVGIQIAADGTVMIAPPTSTPPPPSNPQDNEDNPLSKLAPETGSRTGQPKVKVKF